MSPNRLNLSLPLLDSTSPNQLSPSPSGRGVTSPGPRDRRAKGQAPSFNKPPPKWMDPANKVTQSMQDLKDSWRNAEQDSVRDLAKEIKRESMDSAGEGGADTAKQAKILKRLQREQRNAAINPITQKTQAQIDRAVSQRRSAYLTIPVYSVAFLLLFGLCIGGILYPARWSTSIINLAPMIRQADQRNYLVKCCIFLARELALGDGLSRMTRNELASALRDHIDDLVNADRAIRLGGGLRIDTGADISNLDHNVVMYEKGCPWRDDVNDCMVAYRPGLERQGLFVILLDFIETCENVLSRYRPQDYVYTNSYLRNSDPVRMYNFQTINFNLTKYDQLLLDTDVAFLVSQFDGDLSAGLLLLQDIFLEQKESIMMRLHSDNRVLFALYMSMVIIVFYLILFRATISVAEDQAKRVRKFVDMMPVHVLAKEEVAELVNFFKHDGDDGNLSAKTKSQDGNPEDNMGAEEANEASWKRVSTDETPDGSPVPPKRSPGSPLVNPMTILLRGKGASPLSSMKRKKV
eukprot:CAMPEP_0206239046 /NCGR_PEP_ID=MMETSP0047_2-20121206/15161_1 /ASSEMBLY_ACC=CAM_ASM_000192 /TAXON_ID=195065 /ORGANISM="Chroomonas mesostigmatica_cf, Strain CCMP1168" /LENGTH=520 /DNA_ID=CAMNT_0053663665 /DNA_START=30 /DNA_END=1592 /DNA_ORIENTATION=+